MVEMDVAEKMIYGLDRAKLRGPERLMLLVFSSSEKTVLIQGR